MRRNFFFEEAESLFGPVSSVQDLVPPAMRETHAKAMVKLAEGDGLVSPHSFGFLFTATQHLLSARILVQVVPSIA